MKKILKWLLVLLAIAAIAIIGLLSYVKFALPKVNPAQEMKIDYTAERVERGRYLANHVMLCMACHSERDFTRFAGPPKHGTFGAGGEGFTTELGFPGNYYSANLTPYHLKDWTDGEIFRAMTTGVSRDGHALFPIMPWQDFAVLDQEDLQSVIAYVRTLEPIEHDPPKSESEFPMNFIINTMPEEARFTTRPMEDDKVAYGKYMFTASHCNKCHTKTVNGKALPGMYLAGGMGFPFPGLKVHSANITTDKETGIGAWTEEIFLNKFHAFNDSTLIDRDIRPGDFQTPMPWVYYSKMKDNDLKAIFAYLQTVPPVKNKVIKFELTKGKASQ